MHATAMRLTRLYLAGFKSFATPTEIALPAPLVAIVGPNGCGKSNLIDAVRWVLGESSAKQLRGQALDDVIFAGSGGRPPASQAVVELGFDNSERRLTGPFSAYDQIVIRRSLGRDGQSRYSINQTKVRRRDVIDLFLGTGVGARSYSVIEQGQINRIVDARPEELRAYLEEAAGISLYRERRRETESRISQTQENLSRLSDLADELGRQQNQLERQAKTAERYRVLQKKWRRQVAEQAAVQHILATRAHETLAARLTEQQADLTRIHAEGEQINRLIADLEHQRGAVQDELRQLQSRLYEVAAERAQVTGRLGELAARQEAIEQQRQDDRAQQTRLADRIEQQRTEREALHQKQQTLETERTQAQEQRALAQAELRVADEELARLRADWLQANEALATPQQQLAARQAERATLLRQHQRLAAEPAARDQPDQDDQRRRFAEQIAQLETQHSEEQARCDQHQEAHRQAVADMERQTQAAEQAQDIAHERIRTRDGLLAERNGLERLLSHTKKQAAPRTGTPTETLMQRLATAQADPWWGHVLGAQIEADCIPDLDALHAAWTDSGQQPNAGWWVAPAAETFEASSSEPVLSDELGPWLADWQKTRHPAPSLTEALARRAELSPGHVFVLADGWQVGRHWMGRPAADQAAIHLQQQTRLNTIRDELVAAEHSAEQAQEQARNLWAEVKQTRQRADALALKEREAHQTCSRLAATLADVHRKQERAEQQWADESARRTRQEAERQRIEAELVQLDEQIAETEREVAARNAARNRLTEQQQEAERLVQERRRASGAAAQQAQTLERACDQNRQQGIHIDQALARDQAQWQHIDQRLAEFDDKALALTRQLEEARAAQGSIEQRQQALSRQEAEILAKQDGLTRVLNGHLAERTAHQLKEQKAQTDVQATALQVAQAEVHATHTAETRAAAEQQLADDQEILDETAMQRLADIPQIEAAQKGERLNLEQQIARLGPVNLTAIAAYEEVRGRKAELDQQMADVQAALDQLTDAIRTLDRQTRAKFRAVFEAVNERLTPLFERLFGGGEARLDLTDGDELNAGVTLFARPPGKKTTQLSLLSGGERSLTAVALIFALFQLNPAPFCILDEVDAPLDEANVGRFCAMVSAMSDRVQFLFVTHNKTTMASASALVGVTMREAGVSRIVSVDVDRAVQLLES
ncbi:chromosome segregation protein SMC [Halothiobacillus diazotrophicus]|uniref:Chromosome partition protein Smc n=1 Tax=Halothiobacillus diazotrophicus TaxID=1860122 RepID=A0A191ZHG6_9GAMM|nr:chromosome segregation protein SMC [Halothiobacillus diazotrophicus]ANJ67292.1 chromosome segregation protein SMC [Halothiobacillus diazotrophicus]